MSKAARTTDIGRGPFHRLSDSEILLFVSRTLQPQPDDAGAPNVFAKLQDLKGILDRQDALLAELPAGSGKDRIGEALANAKTLLAQIVDDLAGAAKKAPAALPANSA